MWGGGSGLVCMWLDLCGRLAPCPPPTSVLASVCWRPRLPNPPSCPLPTTGTQARRAPARAAALVRGALGDALRVELPARVRALCERDKERDCFGSPRRSPLSPPACDALNNPAAPLRRPSRHDYPIQTTAIPLPAPLSQTKIQTKPNQKQGLSIPCQFANLAVAAWIKFDDSLVAAALVTALLLLAAAAVAWHHRKWTRHILAKRGGGAGGADDLVGAEKKTL